MNKCEECGRSIPSGRRYCSTCWTEKMREYNEAMKEYKQELKEYKSLSPEERAALDKDADDSSLKIRSYVFFLVLTVATGSAGFLLKQVLLYVCAAIILFVGIFLSVKFYRIVGRLASAILFGCIGAGIGFFGPEYILTNQNVSNSHQIAVATMIGGLVIGAIIGLVMKKTAKPKKPVKPSNKGSSGPTQL